MRMYAKIRDYDATIPAGVITTWNIDYDACRAVNGEAGVVQLRAFNDIEAQGEFVRFMAARGHTVKWVRDFEAAWTEAQAELDEPPQPVDDGSCDPLYGQRMDSADMGEERQ